MGKGKKRDAGDDSKAAQLMADIVIGHHTVDEDLGNYMDVEEEGEIADISERASNPYEFARDHGFEAGELLLAIDDERLRTSPPVSGFNSSSGSSDNGPSQQHSFVGQGRRNMRRAVRDAGGGILVGGADGGVSLIENMDADMKRAQTLDFKGYPLKMTNFLGGDFIKTTDKDRENLKKFAEAPDDDGGDEDGGSKGSNPAGRKRLLLAPEDAFMEYAGGEEGGAGGSGSGGGGGPNKDLMKHIHCRLCKHVSMRNQDSNPDVMNAYDLIVKLDIAKHGYTTEAQLYQEMAILFNQQQKHVGKNGGQFFVLTTEEVRDHFREHDISNPLRPIGERMMMEREVLRQGSECLFGNVNGKKHWHKQNSKLFATMLAHYRQDSREYEAMRTKINNGTSNPRMRMGLGIGGQGRQDDGGQKESRHLASAPKRRRYGGDYV